MSTIPISARDETGATRPARAPARLKRWWRRALLLAGRGVLDCACLVRSRHRRRDKARILLEYVRLTAKLLLGADPVGARPEHVLGYRVRHFGYESLQFLFREIFVRSDYFFAAGTARALVVDCGANIGLATLFFKWLHPQCEVHAFEPDPETFAALRENVERNGLADVHLHNVALSDREGTFDFFLPRNGAGSLMMSLVRGRLPEEESRRIAVNGRTLSGYLAGRDVDFVKMDIEGGEHAVLGELSRAGALRRVKELVVEYHHNLQGNAGSLAAFLQLLQDSGYSYQVDATRGVSTAPQDVLVWARRETGPAGA